MSNNKQSSVEWYAEQIDNLDYNPLEKNGYVNAKNRLLEQAKAMHKQEVMRAYNASYNGFGLFSDGYALAEIYYDQYYNETFNTKEK